MFGKREVDGRDGWGCGRCGDDGHEREREREHEQQAAQLSEEDSTAVFGCGTASARRQPSPLAECSRSLSLALHM